MTIQNENYERTANDHTNRSTWWLWSGLLLLTGVVAWSWSSGGLIHDLLTGEQDAKWKMARLQQFFVDCGTLSPLVYVLFVIVEVIVAPIPGVMLYAPGGMIFGGPLGGALALVGNVAGAGIACLITRCIRPQWLNRFFTAEQLASVQIRLEQRGSWIVFWLRLNPLTSSDIVSYAAGFTRIPIWKVMLATGLAMAPLCFAQAWFAESLLHVYPGLVYPLLVAIAIYVVAIAIVLRRMFRSPDDVGVKEQVK